ncbi:MAG TPA: GNAT family N-acetyltransferase [Kofleriaceae bacterium]|nr:GNAT family N-acetyltransferase [Kofleriaceae bacterium]
MAVEELLTPRLRLRAWRDDDRAPFAAMCADPEVMAYFPERLDRAAADATVERIVAHHAQHGFGLWAVEVPERGLDFAGFIGLMGCRFEAHFTPAVEVGWRLCRAAWGAGYATEGARASVRHGFETLGLGEIVSLTVPANRRSWAVMERLGMRRDPADDFDHPRVPEGSPLRRHVLYRLARADWEARRLAGG